MAGKTWRARIVILEASRWPSIARFSAVGYAACFQSALLRIAAGRQLDLTGARISARVGIGTLKGGGFGLQAALDLARARA